MTIFSKIIAGEIPCYKIAENQDFFAFLDINPLRPGHTLVIPKVEIDYFFDLPAEHLAGLTVFAQDVARAIKKTVECERIGMTVIGLEVPHAHIHLIPIRSEADMSFSKERVILSSDAMQKIAADIRTNLVQEK